MDLIGECNRDQRSHLPSSKSEGAARNARGPPGVLFYLRKIHRQEQQQQQSVGEWRSRRLHVYNIKYIYTDKIYQIREKKNILYTIFHYFPMNEEKINRKLNIMTIENT